MSTRELPLPPLHDPEKAARWDYGADPPSLVRAAAAWRREHDIPPAAADRFHVHLLLIDVQRDFCLPRGALYVGGRSGMGAVDDSRRTVEFIYRNLDVLTRTTATLDTHLPYQIFFPAFWLTKEGAPPETHREVSTADVESGRLRPNPALASWICEGDYDWLVRHATHYCAELERTSRYRLHLWPPHCLAGGDGHSLVGAVDEARLFHAFARGAESAIEYKGDNPLTENYSVLRPEVLTHHDGSPLAARNLRLLDALLVADAIVIAGQAASHCVMSTVDDLLAEIRAVDAGMAARVHILTDCMSAVTVPDGKGGFLADYTPLAEAAFRRWADAGMHLAYSTEPMRAWPGMRLD